MSRSSRIHRNFSNGSIAVKHSLLGTVGEKSKGSGCSCCTLVHCMSKIWKLCKIASPSEAKGNSSGGDTGVLLTPFSSMLTTMKRGQAKHGSNARAAGLNVQVCENKQSMKIWLDFCSPRLSRVCQLSHPSHPYKAVGVLLQQAVQTVSTLLCHRGSLLLLSLLPYPGILHACVSPRV